MREGLDWIFKYSEEKYKTITNQDLVIKIGDIRELIGGLFGKSKLNVKIYYASNSIDEPSPNYKKEVADTKTKFQNEGFQEFEFYSFGPQELIDKENKNEKIKKIISQDLLIEYDDHNKSVIHFQSREVKAAICTVKGVNLAELVKKHDDVILEENVRNFLGVNHKNRSGLDPF